MAEAMRKEEAERSGQIGIMHISTMMDSGELRILQSSRRLIEQMEATPSFQAQADQ